MDIPIVLGSMSIEFADPDVCHRILNSGGSAEVGDKKEHNMTLNFAGWMPHKSVPYLLVSTILENETQLSNITNHLSVVKTPSVWRIKS